MKTTRHRGVALVLALTLGGCTVGTPSSPPPPTAAPSVAAAAVSPSPTSGTDVGRLLAEQFAKVTSGGSTMTGTLAIGPTQATFTGSTLFNGPDSTQRLSMTVGGAASTQQSATVAGERYIQVGDGPWLSNDAATGSGDGLAAELKRAMTEGRDLDAGAVDVASHTIEAADRPFDPAIMGFGAGGSGGRATFAFEAKPDGTPVSVAISATWRQTETATPLDASLEMAMTFTGLNTSPRIAAPEDVWERFTSARWAYSGAHPSDFDMSSEDAYDLLVGTDDTFVTMARTKNKGSGLNVLSNGEIAVLKDVLGTKTVSNDPITVGSLEGRLLSARGSSRDLGGKVIIHEVIAVEGRFAYVFVWVTKGADAAGSLTTFKQLVSTIAIGT